jgi:hypothetical protein
VKPLSPAGLVGAVAAAPATARLAFRGRALQLAGTLDVLAAVGEARRLAHALADARGFTDLGDLGQAGDLARTLDAALAHAHDCVARLRYSPGCVDDIARAIGDGPAKIGDVLRTIDLDRALLLAQARVTSLALALAGEIGTGSTLSSIEVSDASPLRDLVNDMAGADLRDVDLSRVTLDGVRWSDGTRWPARWVKHIRRHSVEVGEGVYEYRPGTTHIGGSLTLVLN